MIDLMEKIVDRIDHIPRIKSVPQKILMVLSDDQYSIQEVSRIVETDMALTTCCLKTVNSASFGFKHKVDSIHRALSLLGQKKLVDIIMKEAFKDVFMVSMSGYGANADDFWNYSFRTAISSRIIASKFLPDIQPNLAYTAGLVHDIGKIVISQFLETAEPNLGSLLTNRETQDFLETEESILGTNHVLVGEKMAEIWQLPDSLKSVIRYHHAAAQAPSEYRELTAVVNAGLTTTILMGMGTGVDSFTYRIDPYVEELLKLDKKSLFKLIWQIDQEYLDIISKLPKHERN